MIAGITYPEYKGRMQVRYDISPELKSILDLWPDVSEMSVSLSTKPDTIYKWIKRGRVPEEWWQPIIDAALVKGRMLTASDLLTANRPPKLRGRPAHKVRRIRRRKAVETHAG